MTYSIQWIMLLLGSNILLNFGALAENARCVTRSFQRILDDQRLSRHIIARYNVKHHWECAKECIDNKNCQSYNYQYGGKAETKACELNNMTCKYGQQFMKREYGFGYYEENVNEALIGSYQNPGQSCEHIFRQCRKSHGNKDGEYWILKDESGPTRVFCNMTAIGGLEYSVLFHGGSTADYVISTGAPPMTAITACFWIKSSDRPGIEDSYISYAVPSHDNEFLSYSGNSGLAHIIGNTGLNSQKAVKVDDGKWHPICFTWSNQEGEYKIYKDGKIEDQGVGFKKQFTIEGAGTWVLGQDQDAVRGGFQVKDALKGEITEVNIWKDIIPEQEIFMFSECCRSKLKGNVKSWENFKSGVSGNATKIPKSPSCL